MHCTFRVQLIFPTLKVRGQTREKARCAVMILFFTSDHCAWCPALKQMLHEELDSMGCTVSIHEINIESYPHIAEIFGILIIPTLVHNDAILSGIPSITDLRAFLFHSITTDSLTDDDDLMSFLHVSRKNDDITVPSREEMLQKLSEIEELVLDIDGIEKESESDIKLEETTRPSQVQ